MTSQPSRRKHMQYWSYRGLLLAFAALVVFVAFALCVFADIARVHALSTVSRSVGSEMSAIAAIVLATALPITSGIAWSLLLTDKYTLACTRGMQGEPVPVRFADRLFANKTFAIYQAVAWALYLVFLLVGSYCPQSRDCSTGYQSGAAVAALIAEVLLISSILTLGWKQRTSPNVAGKGRFFSLVNNFNNMLLVVSAIFLALGSESARHVAGTSSTYAFATAVGSLALVFTAVFNTYGLGGVFTAKRTWKFYQPFTGGAQFVLFQSLSWTCFGVGVFIQALYLISMLVIELELFFGAMIVVASLFLISHVLMMVSLLVFRDKDDSVEPDVISRLRAVADECVGALTIGLLTNIQYIPGALTFVLYRLTTNLDSFGVVMYTGGTFIIEFLLVAVRSIAMRCYLQDSNHGHDDSVSVYHPKYALPQLLIISVPGIATYYHYIHSMEALLPVSCLALFVYTYMFTYRGFPEETGCRVRQSWMYGKSRCIEQVDKYFQSRIIREEELNSSRNYVFCFQPHGIMATTVMYLPFTERWRKHFPNLTPHILVASILHQIPLARDVLQFFGGREVTRQSFASALENKESVLLVPGGQSEMLEQQSGKKQVRILTRHRGFIRMAMVHGTPLVPMLSFNEAEVLDNVRMPMLQKWFVKHVAFPVPFWPHGRLLLPIPRKKYVVVVIGSAMDVSKVTNPTSEQIAKVHEAYYAKVEALFHKYKVEADCPDHELVFVEK